MSSNFKKYNRDFSVATPNVFLSDALAPDRFIAAPYLPLGNFDKREEDFKVMMAGKPICVDTKGFAVLAGLEVQLRKALAAAGNYNFGTGQSDRLTRYTQTDIDEGVKNSLGETVKLNEPVIYSFFKTNAAATFGATENVDTAAEAIETDLSAPVGVLQYDVWRQNGAGFTNNPMNYSSLNYNMQQSVAIYTSHYMEVPVVADYTAYDAMPLKNTIAFVGTATSTLKGIKIDAGSNFVPWVKGTDAVDERIGKVVRLLGSTEFPRNALDKVLTWPVNTPSSFGALDKPAGKATGGLPEKATYAGLDAGSIVLLRVMVDFKR